MRSSALLALALAIGACDRPIVDPAGPSFLEVSPDLSFVRLEADITLRLRLPQFEGAQEVTVDGTEAPFDPASDTYALPLTLNEGLNLLRVEITDDAGFVRRDTLAAVHLPLQQVSLVASTPGRARADAAAVPLPDGRVLISGGIDGDGQALGSATVLQPGGVQIESREVGLGVPRAGHTASVLPDGRILLLGGALTDRPASASEFVTTVEVVDPASLAVSRIETDDPPRRAGHTAQVLTVDNETYVYLYGGAVPAGSGTTVSGTVDVYRLGGVAEGAEAGAELTRLSPEGGAGGFARVTGHVQVPLLSRGALVLGRDEGDEPVALSLFWQQPGTAAFPFDLQAQSLPEAVGGRAGAAAVEVGNTLGGSSLVLVVGGETNIGLTGSLEVVAPGLGRSFRVPDTGLQVPRDGHTATILSNRRIVVSGGRSAAGTALTALEAFEF